MFIQPLFLGFRPFNWKILVKFTYLSKGLKLKYNGHTNFYECCDLTKKVYLVYTYICIEWKTHLYICFVYVLINTWIWKTNSFCIISSSRRMKMKVLISYISIITRNIVHFFIKIFSISIIGVKVCWGWKNEPNYVVHELVGDIWLLIFFWQ